MPEASAPITLVQDTAGQRGFLMVLATRDPAGKDIGVAIAAFQIDELIDQVFPPASRRADIDLYDAGSGRRAARSRAPTRRSPISTTAPATGSSARPRRSAARRSAST